MGFNLPTTMVDAQRVSRLHWKTFENFFKHAEPFRQLVRCEGLEWDHLKSQKKNSIVELTRKTRRSTIERQTDQARQQTHPLLGPKLRGSLPHGSSGLCVV